MLRELSVRHRSLPLHAPFRIARGVKHAADVAHVELRQGDIVGRGESVPYARYGESVPSVLDEIEALRAAVCAGLGRDELQLRLPPGAEATVQVAPERGFDVGAGPGKPVERTVRGGTVGLILDARGRPLRLPEPPAERRATVTRWVKALSLYDAAS